MCGIVYGHSTTPVKERVWEQYTKQKTRGTEGFGVYDGKHVVKAAEEKRIKRWFKRKDNNPTTLLFHHRYPTSTPNVRRAAHPFHTGEYFGNVRYILVHNGVIRNPRELKDKHEKLGISYVSTVDNRFNDSEALLWEFALTLEGKQDKVEAYGDMAVICIKEVDGIPDKLYFTRNSGRPLNLDRHKDELFLSSEGEGTAIDPHLLYTYNYKLNRLTEKYFNLPLYNPSSYSHSTTTSRLGAGNTRTYDSYDSWYGGEGYYDHGSGEVYYDDYYIDRNGDTHLYTDEFEHDYEVYDDGDSDEVSDEGVVVHYKELAAALNKPTQAKINAEYWRLIQNNDGNYKDAYWEGSAELYIYEKDVSGLTDAEYLEMQALSEALKMMVNDANYVNEDSVHPLWQTKPDTTQQTLIPVGGM